MENHLFYKHRTFLIIGLMLSLVIVLEIAGRHYECQAVNGKGEYKPPVCEPDVFQDEPQILELLQNLKEKRKQGVSISAEEYDIALDKLIVEVDEETIGGYNGLACNGAGYVRTDLPPQVKLYVKRHELAHLLATGDERNPEFTANLVAAQDYPIGCLGTILFTVQDSRKYFPSLPCYVVGLWKTFKVYFLPF